MQHTNPGRNTLFPFAIASLVVYALLGVFAGLPAGANLPAFVIGLVLLFTFLALLIGVTWYAVVMPLPAPLSPSKKLPLTHRLRLGVALFLTLMSGMGILGGLWDVTWHVHSGLPFGEDFFWAPHQFIYAALIIPIGVAAYLWYRLLRSSGGSLRQRLQADVPVTLIIMGGVAMALTLPADPLWHVIYGEDLTGLSVPHIVFSVSATFSLIGTTSILLSYAPARPSWGSIARLTGLEWVILLSLAFSFISLLMPMLGDWEAIALRSHALPRLPALVAERPDWALPFLASFVAVYSGSLALHITRRVGAATLMWVIATIVRSLLFAILGYGSTGIETMLLTLPFVIAVDLVAWLRASRGQSIRIFWIAIIATLAGAVGALPQIPVSFTDPILSAGNLPPMIVAMFVGALTAALMGRVLGEVVAGTRRFAASDQPGIAKPAIRVVSALTVVIAFVAVFFILTSTMPAA
jgi:hypothetical protein